MYINCLANRRTRDGLDLPAPASEDRNILEVLGRQSERRCGKASARLPVDIAFPEDTLLSARPGFATIWVSLDSSHFLHPNVQENIAHNRPLCGLIQVVVSPPTPSPPIGATALQLRKWNTKNSPRVYICVLASECVCTTTKLRILYTNDDNGYKDSHFNKQSTQHFKSKEFF